MMIFGEINKIGLNGHLDAKVTILAIIDHLWAQWYFLHIANSTQLD